MSSLHAKMEEQFQLCLDFLGLNASENENLAMKIEYEKQGKSSFKLFLQKVGFKEKSNHVKDQKPNPKIKLQKLDVKVTIEHIEEQGPTPKSKLQQLDLKVKIKHVKNWEHREK
jgi:hypothetical protein